jgi:citrate lyase subunit alpha/citrate CoA-transferase
MAVTEAGIALNPAHPMYEELLEDLTKAGIRLTTLEELQRLAESIVGVPDPIETTGRVVAVVEYRDGTVIDTIQEIKPREV